MSSGSVAIVVVVDEGCIFRFRRLLTKKNKKSIFISQKIRVVGTKGQWGKGVRKSVLKNFKNKSIFMSEKIRAGGERVGDNWSPKMARIDQFQYITENKGRRN